MLCKSKKHRQNNRTLIDCRHEEDGTITALTGYKCCKQTDLIIGIRMA